MAQEPRNPISFNSDDLVQITELRNGLPLQDYNLSDTQFEDFICTNLVNENLPYDLTDNFPYDSEHNTSSLSFRLDQDENGPQLLGKTIILNNETLINSETFAMKMNYASTGNNITPDYSDVKIGNRIETTIALDASSNSIYDSNLKITIDVNNDTQYTDYIEENDQTVWGVDFDRSTNSMAYFAAINSVYEQDEAPSPFYIIEESNNNKSLGNDNSLWFLENTQGISSENLNGILEYNSITYNNQLETNHIYSEVNNEGYSSFSDFNKYKIVQSKPHTDATLSASGSQLPVQYVDGSPVDLSSTTFNFDGVFQNTQNVGSGFTIELTISENTDPYSVDENELFSVDNSSLIRNANEPYIQLTNLENINHKLVENTGTLTLNTSTSNSDYIEINNDYETLDYNYYGTDGFIQIKVDSQSDRVYYSNGSNENGSHGTSSSLTDYVNIVYCGEEQGAQSTCISGDLLTTNDVSFYLEVKSTSTVYSNVNDFFNEDSRNLAYDNSSILVIADPSNNTSANPEDFTLQSDISVNDHQVYIISIQNESVLTEESQLLNPSNNPVSGTNAKVTMTGIDLSGLPYTDFRVRLATQKVSDISNQLHLTNSWTLKNPNDYLIGTALKTSVIYDDYLFMTTDPSMNINMRYEFQVANPVCASTQAIKHAVKITFTDLSENLQYNANPTIFYLDDQDITINQVSIVDTSGVTCNDISSNNVLYPVSDYTFQKYTRTRTYTAEFDSKFQFYENLTFVTPTVTENAIFYKIFKNGVEQPSYLLRYFSCIGEGHLLSNVYVSLAGQPIYTQFAYTQTVCSIFRATIFGKDQTDNYVLLPNIDPVPIDPFFRQNCVILNITNGGHGRANINVRFDNGVDVDQPYYYIEMQNALGANISLTSKRYIYDTLSNGSQLDNYTPYNNFYGTLMSGQPLLYTNVEQVGDNLTVTIKTSQSGTTLAVITQPNNYLNDYNIIVCPVPLLQVDYTIGSNDTVSSRRLVFNNSLKIIDGIYYYLDSVTLGASESFNLVTDSFRLWFVDDENFPNNDTSFTGDFVKFSESNIQTWLTCLSDSYNQTRSIGFDQLRGYQRANNIDGIDDITVTRTSMSVTFWLDNFASQTFDNIYYGKEVTVNSVYDGDITYNLGLKLSFTKSMLTDSNTEYPIFVSLPEYTLTIISNPYNTNIEDIISSGYLPSNSNLFSPYFDYVKPASIKSNAVYTITVTYTVPNAILYYATTPSYIGDPTTVTQWTQQSTISHNNLLDYYLVLDSFSIWRDSNYNVFYDNFTAFFVISPPVVSVYSNDTTITQIPIDYNPQYIGSFHINTFNNEYVNNTQSRPLTFFEDSIKSYYSYLDVNTNQKRFRIEGNFLTVQFFAGGTGTGATGPAAIDASGIVLDTLFDGIPITQLENNGYYDNSNVRVEYNGYSYNIYYKQFLLSAHSNNSSENILFNVGNAFISTNNNSTIVYLRLPSGQGTNVDFYQANVYYDISGENSSYYMIIDRYESDINVNYNTFLDTSVRELFFPITNHYVKQIAISGENIIDGNGNLINYSDLVDLITYADISQSEWVEDLSFTSIQYSGITISSITEQGRINMQSVFKYNSSDSLQSKVIYVYRPDLIRATNLIGSPIYRVTNGGNVHAPRVTTSNLSLFVSPNPVPVDSSIPGFNDILSIFAQNSLMNSGATFRP